MKKFFMTIVLTVMTILPQVYAQTATQQKELGEIAARSVNGLSEKDRQRVVEIMTDVYVKMGMSKQQAAKLAAVAADGMAPSATAGTQGLTPEQQRQFAEQDQMLDRYNQGQSQQTQQQPQQQNLPGENAGWPSAQLREWGLSNLKQPSGIQPSYTVNQWSNFLTVFMTGANKNTLQSLKRQIETALKVQLQFNGNANEYGIGYSNDRGVNLKLNGDTLTMTFYISAS